MPLPVQSNHRYWQEYSDQNDREGPHPTRHQGHCDLHQKQSCGFSSGEGNTLAHLPLQVSHSILCGRNTGGHLAFSNASFPLFLTHFFTLSHCHTPSQLNSLPGGVVVFGNKKRLGREACKHKLVNRAKEHGEVVGALVSFICFFT